jgi:hypothetical protein
MMIVVFWLALVGCVHKSLALFNIPATLTAVEHRGSCPATHAQFHYTDAIETVTLTPEDCFARCVGDGRWIPGEPGCVFAFRSVRSGLVPKCVLFVDKRKVTGNGDLQVRKGSDCGPAVASSTGNDNVFLLPRIKLSTFLHKPIPVGTQDVVNAVHNHLPRARDRWLRKLTGPESFINQASKVSFDTAERGGAGCCAYKCPEERFKLEDKAINLNVTGSLDITYGKLADEIGRQLIWDELFEPAYRRAFFTEKVIGGLPTFVSNDCMCTAAGLCPSDPRICISGLSWRNDIKTYTLPGYMQVTMYDVVGTTSGVVEMRLGAQMAVVLSPGVTQPNWGLRSGMPADFTCGALIGAVSLGAGVAVSMVNPPFGFLLSLAIGFLDVFCVVIDITAQTAQTNDDELCERCKPSELTKATREALQCNRTCLDPNGWYESAPHFFEAMSDDCDFVNGVPIRTFWAQIAGNPAAAKRLRSNYYTCKGLIDDPLLTKIAKIADIKKGMDAQDAQDPQRRPCSDKDWQ